jgi:epoxyqueuosine reductase
VSLSQSQIRDLALQAGFTLGGIAAVPEAASSESSIERERFAQWVEAGRAGEMDYLKRTNDSGEFLRSSARTAFPWARSVIVCLADYSSPHPRSIDPAPKDSAWIARYAWSGNPSVDGQPQRPSDYHKVLLKRLQGIDAALREQHPDIESRCYVDTGPLVERVYARYAGLGWTGKNTCLLNQQLGSWLFLGVILTSLEIPPEDLAIPTADRCGSCTRCIDACPTQALTPYRMDASRCIAYLTIEKRGSIPAGDHGTDLREGIGRNIFGCDICQDVCPWNQKSAVRKVKKREAEAKPEDSPEGGLNRSSDSDLVPREALVNPALDWLAGLTEQDFGAWFFGSPVKRARYPGFRRNLAIAMGNSGLISFLPRLREWSCDPDEGLSEAAKWALHKLENSENDAAR